MYYIGLDVHKRTISYCVKDAAGHVHQEGKIGSTRRELDAWIKTLPQPRTIAMEATIFTGNYEWKTVTLLAMGFGLVGLDRWILAPLFPAMMKDLHLNYADLGTSAGALALAWASSR
jgi:hypothetical protein